MFPFLPTATAARGHLPGGAAAVAVLLAFPLAASAAITLNDGAKAPALFADGMVLQREVPIPFWGRGAVGEEVSVTIAGQTRTTTTAGDGAWRVVLDPVPAGGPYDVTIAGSNTIVLTDVLVGDVWICAGQSNMIIHRASRNELESTPDIHTLGRRGEWYDRPSAIAWNFGQGIVAAEGVPVGLINRAAGGTAVRNWMGDAVTGDPDPDVQAIVSGWDKFGEQYAHQVKPFEGFPIRGVVYWQGEQDLKLARQDPGSVDHYYHLLPALIRSWRAAWQRSDLPFVFVQLPTGGGLQLDQTVSPLPPSPPEPDIAAKMRAATFNGLEEPYTGLAASIDIDGGVHPKNREEYAARIADAALARAYGQGFAWAGPLYSSMSIESGNRVRLHFRSETATGLHAVGGPLQGFAISDDGEHFVWADAIIDGSDVVVWNDAITAPTVVRYGWDRRPTWANLFNDAGLGAAPFSTTTIPAP